MREGFKSQIKINGRRFLLFVFDEVARFRQSFILQPVPRRHTEYLFKIPLEPCQTPSGELRKSFNWNVKMVIADHEPFQVNLPRV